MAKSNPGAGAAANGRRLLTLTDVAKQLGVSMPTLQKYKKRYADRIPSVGKGRKQRYPEEALPVFEELRRESLGRRGRPRKSAAGAAATGAAAGRRGRRARKAGRRAAAGKGVGKGLLTLTQVAETTGISYPTLLRYVKTHLSKLPHAGSGRARRFRPEAVEVFRRLRAESRSGRPPGSGVKRRGRKPAAARRAAAGRRGGRPPGAAAGAGLLASLRRLEQRLARVEAELKKPLRVEVRR
jgi:DNA-binding transcriptional MerR regulator